MPVSAKNTGVSIIIIIVIIMLIITLLLLLLLIGLLITVSGKTTPVKQNLCASIVAGANFQSSEKDHRTLSTVLCLPM